MTKSTAILALTLLVLLAPAMAQDEPTIFERFPSALGAYGCTMTTGGLSYQHWFGRIGLQVSGGALAYTSGYYDYNAQGTLQYMLYGEDFASWFSGALYANALLGHRGQGSTTGDAYYSPFFFLGAGVGIETVLLRHLALNVEFMYIGSLPLQIDFGFAAGLRYRF